MEKVALYVQALNSSKTWLEKKVENPETGRMVKVKSLSPEQQAQYRPKSDLKKHKDKIIDHHVDVQSNSFGYLTVHNTTPEKKKKLFNKMYDSLSGMRDHITHLQKKNPNLHPDYLKTRDVVEQTQMHLDHPEKTKKHLKELGKHMKNLKKINPSKQYHS